MDKIVDHLFVFRGEGQIEDFPGNYSDFRIYEDSAEPKTLSNVSTEKVSWKEKNTASAGLNFNEQKEFNKLEREIKDLEYNKKQIEQEFADGKVSDDKIEAKANELQKIIQSLEEKEERWFELSSKME
jgi:ATP-binding cassette subfamily F protein uup